MATPLRALIVDDSEDDALLLVAELKRGGFAPAFERVETAEEMARALDRAPWDVVLADFRLPRFSGPAALQLVRERGVDIPLIMVSGAIGEETAVASLKAGAHDFVVKDNLARLAPAIARELREVEVRRERRRAEAALADSETRFRSLIENSSDLISIFAADGTTRYVSPSLTRILGYEPGERIGRRAFENVHPEDAPRVRESFEAVVGGDAHLQPIQYRVHHKDGTWRTVESVGANLLAIPSVAGIVVNSRDVTDRVRLEAELRHAQRMEALGQVTGGFAHDFNNLLAVVLASADLVAAAVPDPQTVAADLGALRDAVRRGQEMIRNLMGFARQGTVLAMPTAVGEVVERYCATLQRLLPETVALRLELADALPRALADPAALEQMLLNLANNGRDAMPHGGTMTLSVRRERFDGPAPPGMPWLKPGDYVAVAVADTGTGMDAEALRRIFEPFFTTKPLGQGTGLGMSMVYGLMKQQRGYVLVDSAPGRGTTVRLLFREASEPAGPG